MARRQEWQKEAPAPAEDNDERAYDPDVAHTLLAIRLTRFGADHEKRWRRCPVAVCRRKHACSAPDIACYHLAKPRPPLTDAQANAAMARVRASLEARLKAAGWKTWRGT